MTTDDAITAGGWDPRYAVVRAVVTHGDVAAVLVDPNGDGGSIDVDEYLRGPDGTWVEVSSGGSAGDSVASWSPHMVATYGRTAPGVRILVDYCGETCPVMTDEDGWWLFATRSLDGHSMPAGRVD